MEPSPPGFASDTQESHVNPLTTSASSGPQPGDPPSVAADQVVVPPTRSRRRTLGGVLAVGAMALLVVAGCSKTDAATDQVDTLSSGNGPATSAPAASGNDEQKMREYSKCMRENGVPSFPDPTVDANGRVRLDRGGDNGGTPAFDPQSTEFQNASKACASLRQGLTFGPGNIDRTKLQDAALKYAACLREQGLTVKDPDLTQQPTPGQGGPGGGGTGGQGGAGQQPPQGQGGQGGRGTGFLARALGLDENDPAVQKAQETCQPVLTKAMADAGIQAPGGGGAPAPAAGN
jgi:hypothetical protein